MKKTLGAAVALLAAGSWWLNKPYSNLGITLPPLDLPTVQVTDPPFQQNINHASAFRVLDRYEITTLATFSVTARILGIEKYRDDASADLSPADFALGWGRMADPKVYGKLDINQSGRWFAYHYKGEPPIPKTGIGASASNMHIIPADATTAKKLGALKPHQIVSLKGYLIEARRPDRVPWRSSLTREDTGNGACEIVLVQSVERRE